MARLRNCSSGMLMILYQKAEVPRGYHQRPQATMESQVNTSDSAPLPPINQGYRPPRSCRRVACEIPRQFRSDGCAGDTAGRNKGGESVVPPENCPSRTASHSLFLGTACLPYEGLIQRQPSVTGAGRGTEAGTACIAGGVSRVPSGAFSESLCRWTR
jgi:hypothetical protein